MWLRLVELVKQEACRSHGCLFDLLWTEELGTADCTQDSPCCSVVLSPGWDVVREFSSTGPASF